jgi:hypothetical protein
MAAKHPRAVVRKRSGSLRAECYWNLRARLERGNIAIPPDDRLADELLRWIGSKDPMARCRSSRRMSCARGSVVHRTGRTRWPCSSRRTTVPHYWWPRWHEQEDHTGEQVRRRPRPTGRSHPNQPVVSAPLGDNKPLEPTREGGHGRGDLDGVGSGLRRDGAPDMPPPTVVTVVMADNADARKAGTTRQSRGVRVLAEPGTPDPPARNFEHRRSTCGLSQGRTDVN